MHCYKGCMAAVVAVVDDDTSVRESLESLLRSAGLTVRVFASAEEFIQSPSPQMVDCLLLDVRMPGMSGIELHRHLLAQGSKVPVLFMTAHASDEQSRAHALSQGALAYLLKPFDETELLDAVQMALRSASGKQI